MPLYLFYTMVQKSQKWPKTQIKGGPALNQRTSLNKPKRSGLERSLGRNAFRRSNPRIGLVI